MIMTKDIGNKVMVNKSKSYLLPLLNEHVKIKYLYLLENTFINVKSYLECIGLLFKISDDINFIRYCNNLEEHPLFKECICTKNHMLFVFHFPEQFLNEYKYFKLGRYSRFSHDAKKKIVKFFSHNYQYPELVQELVHILYKNRSRKERLEKELGIILTDEDELTSIIDEEEETFKSENYEYL